MSNICLFSTVCRRYVIGILRNDLCLTRSRHQRTCHSKPAGWLLYVIAISFFGLSCGTKAPSECRQLCGLSEEQQHSAFKSYPAEKQLDLYVNCEDEKGCWRDSESPHDYYGQWMAEDKKALPVLLERLQSEKDERVQQDILYVLRFMAVNGHLKGEHDVPKIVNRAVENMKGSLVSSILGGDGGIERSKKWAKEIESSTN